MGVDQEGFYEAISSFSGASKRLELVAENTNCGVYKDFAHSPSKVKATTEAVKSQYPTRPLVACLELHTYSSLNAEFLEHYKGTLEVADTAVVFYSPEAVEIKKLDSVSKTQIETAFERKDLIVFTDPMLFKNYITSLEFTQKTILLMSSGSYGGLDFEALKKTIHQPN